MGRRAAGNIDGFNVKDWRANAEVYGKSRGVRTLKRIETEREKGMEYDNFRICYPLRCPRGAYVSPIPATNISIPEGTLALLLPRTVKYIARVRRQVAINRLLNARCPALIRLPVVLARPTGAEKRLLESLNAPSGLTVRGSLDGSKAALKIQVSREDCRRRRLIFTSIR
ncbi:hypothetical protein KM043_017240 [Ampulex compressa]|nr:hypothetical protein KM043_017240 [Ampulex compressa]